MPPLAATIAIAPVELLAVLVQNLHVHVGNSPKHVVRLVLPADAVERAADEVGPLVRLRLWRSGPSVALLGCLSGGGAGRVNDDVYNSKTKQTYMICVLRKQRRSHAHTYEVS